MIIHFQYKRLINIDKSEQKWPVKGWKNQSKPLIWKSLLSSFMSSVCPVVNMEQNHFILTSGLVHLHRSNYFYSSMMITKALYHTWKKDQPAKMKPSKNRLFMFFWNPVLMKWACAMNREISGSQKHLKWITAPEAKRSVSPPDHRQGNRSERTRGTVWSRRSL